MFRKEILTNAPSLAAAIYFWLSSLNAFVFCFGIKTTILYDLATLFGLRPQGIEIDPTFMIDT